MIYRGYPERDLVANRSSLLLHGSTEAERRAWAEEAAASFAGQGVPLTVAASTAELHGALEKARVIYVPDVAQIDGVTQSAVVRVLRERDERPKVILGVTGSPDRARENGTLRPDLQYALQMAVVNLDEPGLKDAIRVRRARAPKRPAAAPAKTSAPAKRAAPPKRAAATSSSSKRAPAKPRAKARTSGSKQRPAARAASARSARRPAAAAKKKARPSAKKTVRRRR